MIGKYVKTERELSFDYKNGSFITIGKGAKGKVTILQRPGVYYVAFPMTPDMCLNLLVNEKDIALL